MTLISSAYAEMVPARIMADADIAAVILLGVIGLMALLPDCSMPDLRPACLAPVIAD